MTTLDERVSDLEEIMRRLAHAQMTTQMTVDRLGQEMLAFKAEMRAFKDEMRAFKDEMGAFKDEMGAFKDEMGAFKDEMRTFKDEMLAFKDEMLAFKDEMLAFKIEMREDRKNLNRAWGDLANKLGTIIEDIVAPNILRLAGEEFGIEVVDDFFVRRRRRHPAQRKDILEYDSVCVGCGKALLVEVKSNPHPDHLGAFWAKMARFPEFYPEYARLAMVGVFASWALEEDMRAAISRAGLYGIAMGDETMGIVARPEVH